MRLWIFKAVVFFKLGFFLQVLDFSSGLSPDLVIPLMLTPAIAQRYMESLTGSPPTPLLAGEFSRGLRPNSQPSYFWL